MIKENAVGPFQKAAALKVWGKCSDGKRLQHECLRADFVAKVRVASDSLRVPQNPSEPFWFPLIHSEAF